VTFSNQLYMNRLQTIHRLRQEIGLNRQIRHEKEMNIIDNILFEASLLHPYSFNNKLKNRFFEEGWYFNGSKGFKATINEDYAYRISNISKITNAVSEWYGSLLTSKDPAKLFDVFNKDISKRKKWISLSNYANGIYSGPRNFTFWTNIEVNSENILDVTRLIGYPSNWLSNYILIMRIKFDYFKDIKIAVPTVLDSFDSEIFHPTEDKLNPNRGKTICLRKGEELTIGVDEYVIGKIPVEHIEISPVFISDRDIERKCIESNDNLWGALESYYNVI
jgi:hypothetical protein